MNEYFKDAHIIIVRKRNIYEIIAQSDKNIQSVTEEYILQNNYIVKSFSYQKMTEALEKEKFDVALVFQSLFSVEEIEKIFSYFKYNHPDIFVIFVIESVLLVEVGVFCRKINDRYLSALFNNGRLSGGILKDKGIYAIIYTQCKSFSFEIKEIINDIMKKKEHAMLELLVPAVVKFLFDQLDKMINDHYLADKQRKKIEKAQNNLKGFFAREDSQFIEKSLEEFVPLLSDPVIAKSFNSSIHKQLTVEDADFPFVGGIIYHILVKKKDEVNEPKKGKLIKMATAINTDIGKLRDHQSLGEPIEADKKQLHERIMRALDLL